MTNMVKAPGSRECRPIEVKVYDGESADAAFDRGVAKYGEQAKVRYDNSTIGMIMNLFD